MIPTLLDICGIDQINLGRGHSILDKSYVPTIALSERTDSGAPALLHKDAIFTARNKKYLIEYRASIFKSFDDGKLVEVYDLVKDKEELNNIVGTINRKEITDLLECICLRHKQLSENYKEWLKTDMAKRE